jgi:hypothetical protein
VRRAGGELCPIGPLGPDGNPQNKPMALVRLEPDGRYTFQTVVRP